MSLTFLTVVFDGHSRWIDCPAQEGLNLSNCNAADLAASLDLSIEDGLLSPIELPTVIDRCIRYRRAHLGRPDPERPRSERGGLTGPRLIDCGRGAGYLLRRVADLQALAQQGLDGGATHLCGA